MHQRCPFGQFFFHTFFVLSACFTTGWRFFFCTICVEEQTFASDGRSSAAKKYENKKI
jgi:hypothetical protein